MRMFFRFDFTFPSALMLAYATTIVAAQAGAWTLQKGEGKFILNQIEEKQDKAVIIIKQGLVDHTLVVDPEINLAATLIKLARL